MLLSLLSLGPLGFASMPHPLDASPVCACGYYPLYLSEAAAGSKMCHTFFGTKYYMPMDGTMGGGDCRGSNLEELVTLGASGAPDCTGQGGTCA